MLAAISAELSSQVVISINDIRKYYQYLGDNYSYLSHNEMVSAIAIAILKNIYKEIPGVNKAQKDGISWFLINQVNNRDGFEIKKDDLFLAAIDYAVIDSSLIWPLTKWANQQQGNRLQSYTIALVIEILKNEPKHIELENDCAIFTETYNLLKKKLLADNLYIDIGNDEEILSESDLIDFEVSSANSDISCPGNSTYLPANNNHYHNLEIAGLKSIESNSSNSPITNLIYEKSYHEDYASITAPEAHYKSKFKQLFMFAIITLCFVIAIAPLWIILRWFDNIGTKPMTYKAQTMYVESSMDTGLPQELQYKDFREEELRSFLEKKASVLSSDPYYSAVINASQANNVNPLLLFSIAGQEQGFVPRDAEGAFLIANNPFNVYGSWRNYNTSIEKSAQIAAMTVVELSKERPDEIDPIIWINQRYAKDRNWSNGVSYFLDEMQAELSKK